MQLLTAQTKMENPRSHTVSCLNESPNKPCADSDTSDGQEREQRNNETAREVSA